VPFIFAFLFQLLNWLSGRLDVKVADEKGFAFHLRDDSPGKLDTGAEFTLACHNLGPLRASAPVKTN